MRVGWLLAVACFLLLCSRMGAVHPICALCHDIVKQFQRSVPRRSTESLLALIGTAYCTKKHIQNPNVCRGAVSEMIDSIVNSLWRHFTDPHAVCHKLRFCPEEYRVRNLEDDVREILKGKPQREWEKPTGRKVVRVAHVSDLHPDLFYTVGAVEKCTEPVCCRANSTLKLDPQEVWGKLERGEALQTERKDEGGAGYWGSLSNCDLPIQTFNLFLGELEQKDVDLIIWTGDNTPHDVWQQSQTYNLNFTTLLSEKFKKGFKGRVIPAMGNHESFPVNVYDYQGTREQMLLGGLAEAWKDWLGQTAYDMLRTKGYYSVTLPEFNNLKVISVNTQAQNNLNWFLLRDPTDPGGMLRWIEEELAESEKRGQFVYVIGHIPPKEALNDWSMRFNALVDRYAFTIRGQFYGHTHRDHIGFFPSMTGNDSRLVNSYLIAPSLTTYSNKHPEYRVMSIDLDTLQVVDYEQYRLDLTKFTRREDDASFQLFYRFREAYGLQDMTIRGGMSVLWEKMEKDSETQIKYSYFRSSGTEKGTAGRAIYCDTTTSPQFHARCSNASFQPSSFEKAAGSWKDLVHSQ